MKGTKGRKPFNPPRRKGPKPPKPGSMEAEVPSELTDVQVEERRRRLCTAFDVLEGLEAEKRRQNRKINGEIKDKREECSRLNKEIKTGVEMVKQGDLFAKKPGNGKGTRVTEDGAKDALRKVAEKAGETQPEATH